MLFCIFAKILAYIVSSNKSLGKQNFQFAEIRNFSGQPMFSFDDITK